MTRTSKTAMWVGGLVIVLVIAGILAWSRWYDVPVRVPPYGDRGCWVLVFGGKDFFPPVARLKGPTFIEDFESGPVVTPELRDVGGEVFLRTIQSAIVGPRAQLQGFAQPPFDNPSLTLEAGAQVPDLTALNFHDRVKSLKVQCR